MVARGSDWNFYSASAIPHCRSANRCNNHGISVCLSVLPSHSGVLSSRMKIRWCSLHMNWTRCALCGSRALVALCYGITHGDTATNQWYRCRHTVSFSLNNCDTCRFWVLYAVSVLQCFTSSVTVTAAAASTIQNFPEGDIFVNNWLLLFGILWLLCMCYFTFFSCGILNKGWQQRLLCLK